jgi:hypothetical protein
MALEQTANARLSLFPPGEDEDDDMPSMPAVLPLAPRLSGIHRTYMDPWTLFRAVLTAR